jgi:hypothetical protein
MTTLLCTVQCSRVNEWRHYHGQYNVAGSMNDDSYIVLYMAISSFIDPRPIVLSMVMSSFIDPGTLYCPWLCRHSFTLLHCTVHGYVVIHVCNSISEKGYGCKWLYFNLCLSVVLDCVSCSFKFIIIITTSYFFTLICYLCIQCLSPLKMLSFDSRSWWVAPIQHYVIKFVSDLR